MSNNERWLALCESSIVPIEVYQNNDKLEHGKTIERQLNDFGYKVVPSYEAQLVDSYKAVVLPNIPTNISVSLDAERKFQKIKWGDQSNHSDEHWLTILSEEVGEVAKDILENNSSLLKEITQVAAVSIAWLEALSVRKSTKST